MELGNLLCISPDQRAALGSSSSSISPPHPAAPGTVCNERPAGVFKLGNMLCGNAIEIGTELRISEQPTTTCDNPLFAQAEGGSRPGSPDVPLGSSISSGELSRQSSAAETSSISSGALSRQSSGAEQTSIIIISSRVSTSSIGSCSSGTGGDVAGVADQQQQQRPTGMQKPAAAVVASSISERASWLRSII
jgi:hypothetical protein